MISQPHADRVAVRAAFQPLRSRAAHTLVALDFDGTLAPIVPRPEDARALPGTADVLAALADQVARVAIVTGRPAADAVERAGVGDVPGIVVLGHYGLERWTGGRLVAPDEGPGVGRVREAATELALARPGVTLEDKGHSVALHTRRAADPAGALAELVPHVTDLAKAEGMQVTPGRYVLEIRPAGVDKGVVLASLVDEVGATAVVYGGDDVGDRPALNTLRALEAGGLRAVVVCSDADEADPEFRAGADLVVPGPDGVQAALRDLVDVLREPR
ncbi:MAG TPA: trehalose-phosphatase [Jiangellaceae bacterium]